VQRLAGVFFQVGAGQVDGLGDEFAVLLVAEGDAPPCTTGSSNWLIW
jgi:hypothetical protein